MKVPTYDTPTVAPRGLPSPDVSSVASPGLLGAGAEQAQRFGNAAEKAGVGMADMAAQMQERDNVTAVQTALTGIQSAYTDYRTQLEQKRGAEADGITDQTKQWWDDQAAKHAEGLQNPAQQSAFAQKVAQLKNASVASVAQYETGQRRQATQDATTASVSTAINAAVANGDEQSVALAKGQILSSTAALAQLNGWDAPTTLAYGDEQLTKLHTAMLGKLLAEGKASAAQAYYDANKEDINGLAQPKIEQALQMATVRSTAQSFADQVVQPGTSEAEALAAARKQFSGVQETAAVNEIKTRYAERQQILEQNERNTTDAAWQHYDQTGALPPANVLAGMSGQARAELTRYAQQKARGENVQTDWATYHDLREAAATNPQAFMRLNLNDYRTKLAPAQMKEMIDLQAGLHEPAKQQDVATLQQQLMTMHNEFNWGPGDKQKMGAYDSAVRAEIAREQEAKGRALTYDERQKVMDKMAIQGAPHWGGEFNPENWFSSAPRYYETQGLNPQVNPADFTPQIPAGEQAQIDQALKAHGKAVTDKNRMIMFKARYGMLPRSTLNGLTTDGTSTPSAPVSDATISQAIAEESAADAVKQEVFAVSADKAAGIVQRGGGRPLSNDELTSHSVASGVASWPAAAVGAAQALAETFGRASRPSGLLPPDVGERAAKMLTELGHHYRSMAKALKDKYSDFPDLAVPNRMREPIKKALKKHGLPVNDTTIEETYRAMLRLAGQ